MATKETVQSIYEEPSTPLDNNSNCCFCFPRRSSSPIGPSFWERVGSGHHDDRWWASAFRALKKVRDWSEIVAGPKWKTFIRRFNRGRGGAHHRHGQFHYDPLSYSLNFDDRSADFDEEEEVRNFSAPEGDGGWGKGQGRAAVRLSRRGNGLSCAGNAKMRRE